MLQTKRVATRARCTGFSLLELMAAITLMALLASFAIPSYLGYIDDARAGSAVADIGRIALEAERFAANNDGVYPLTLGDMGLAGMADPWGNGYQYVSAAVGPGPMRKAANGQPVNTDFDVYSFGEDGATDLSLTAADSQDDVVRANNGQFVGLAEEF